MKNSMRVAFCGVIAALSTVLFLLTGVVPVATIALPAIAGCLLIPVVVEVGLAGELRGGRFHLLPAVHRHRHVGASDAAGGGPQGLQVNPGEP